MTEFDPLHDKAYAERLTRLGDKRDVVASEDIFNDQGILLVRKGSPINQKIADKIVRFKLVKPIESSVDIENSLGAIELFHDFQLMANKFPEVLAIHKQAGIEQLLKELCSYCVRFPVIRQKLTVMHEQMPKLYTQTISVTWLAVLVAMRMKLSDRQVETCFMAGLCHDIGMMHIDPDVVEKKDQLTPAEWRQIQAHSIISSKVLQSLNGIKPDVVQAVLEHHERCDGTGYPFGKFAPQLSIESQVLALAESVIVIYVKRLVPKGRRLRDLMPVLQVNSESHFYDTYRALIQVLQQAHLDEKSWLTDDTIENEISNLKKKHEQLNGMLQGLDALLGRFKDQLKEQRNQKQLESAKSVMVQILRVVRGSGILDEAYKRWMDQVRKEKLAHAYRELDDAVLMLDEIEWHVMRIKKMMDAFIHSTQEKKTRPANSPTPDASATGDEFNIN